MQDEPQEESRPRRRGRRRPAGERIIVTQDDLAPPPPVPSLQEAQAGHILAPLGGATMQNGTAPNPQDLASLLAQLGPALASFQQSGIAVGQASTPPFPQPAAAAQPTAQQIQTAESIRQAYDHFSEQRAKTQNYLQDLYAKTGEAEAMVRAFDFALQGLQYLFTQYSPQGAR